ncbi:MAG: MATE family efflux transporter [Aeromonas sp.]
MSITLAPYWRDGAAHRRVLALALPMIASNISTPLLGLVDSWVMGRAPDAWLLAGVALGASVVNLIFWLLGFLRMATTGLTAQAYGAGDHAAQWEILLRSAVLALVCAMLVLLAAQGLGPLIARSGGTLQVQQAALAYSQVRLLSAPAALLNLVLMGWLLGRQSARGPMFMLLTTNGLNMLLDAWFVLGLGWQVRGAAWASVWADYATLALGLWLVWRARPRLTDNALAQVRRRLRRWAPYQQVLALNRDIFLRSLCLQLCFAFMTWQGARLGDVALAANALLMNLLLLTSYGLDGFAYAVEAMVGRAQGARDQAALRQAVSLNLVWALWVALSFSALFAVGGDALLAMLSTSAAVVSQAQAYLPWLVLLPLLAVWCFVLDGVFVGLANARAMRNSLLVAAFGGFFPLWWLTQAWGLGALWAAMSGLMLLRGVTLAAYAWPWWRSPSGLSQADAND